MVVFGQKVVVFGQNGSILALWFYFGKLVLFGQIGFIWAKGGCIWAKDGCI